MKPHNPQRFVISQNPGFIVPAQFCPVVWFHHYDHHHHHHYRHHHHYYHYYYRSLINRLPNRTFKVLFALVVTMLQLTSKFGGQFQVTCRLAPVNENDGGYNCCFPFMPLICPRACLKSPANHYLRLIQELV